MWPLTFGVSGSGRVDLGRVADDTAGCSCGALFDGGGGGGAVLPGLAELLGGGGGSVLVRSLNAGLRRPPGPVHVIPASVRCDPPFEWTGGAGGLTNDSCAAVPRSILRERFGLAGDTTTTRGHYN